MSKYVQKAIDAIIRPPRFEYNYKELPLFLNAHDHRVYMRHPLVIENKRNQHIIGSLFHMADSNPMKGGPCVIYLHGNASAQLEGQFLVPNFCPHDIYVFVYDAIGCGCSDGDYISLGYFEKQDIEEIMEFLNQAFGLGPFALWGRSMGAATAALAKSPLLQSIVCDSAYTSIPDIVAAIAKSIGVPGFVVPVALSYLRSKIEKIAKFDLNTVEPIVAVKTARVPAVFGHAVKDQFVPYEMGKKLFDAYACGDKIFYTFERGGHNSRRNAEWIRTSVEFIMSRFGMDTFGLEISECRYLQSSKYHFTSFDTLLQNKESNGAIPRNLGDTSTDNSTEDLFEGIKKSDSELSNSKLIAGYEDEEASACTDADVSSSKEEAYMSDSDDNKNTAPFDNESDTKNTENHVKTDELTHETQNLQTNTENSSSPSILLHEKQNIESGSNADIAPLDESASAQSIDIETSTQENSIESQNPEQKQTETTSLNTDTEATKELTPAPSYEKQNYESTQEETTPTHNNNAGTVTEQTSEPLPEPQNQESTQKETEPTLNSNTETEAEKNQESQNTESIQTETSNLNTDIEKEHAPESHE